MTKIKPILGPSANNFYANPLDKKSNLDRGHGQHIIVLAQ